MRDSDVNNDGALAAKELGMENYDLTFQEENSYTSLSMNPHSSFSSVASTTSAATPPLPFSNLLSLAMTVAGG
jgi:hypothetical protein